MKKLLIGTLIFSSFVHADDRSCGIAAENQLKFFNNSRYSYSPFSKDILSKPYSFNDKDFKMSQLSQFTSEKELGREKYIFNSKNSPSVVVERNSEGKATKIIITKSNSTTVKLSLKWSGSSCTPVLVDEIFKGDLIKENRISRTSFSMCAKILDIYNENILKKIFREDDLRANEHALNVGMNIKDEVYLTPSHQAVIQGSLAEVSKLLAQDIKEIKTEYGERATYIYDNFYVSRDTKRLQPHNAVSYNLISELKEKLTQPELDSLNNYYENPHNLNKVAMSYDQALAGLRYQSTKCKNQMSGLFYLEFLGSVGDSTTQSEGTPQSKVNQQ